MTTEEARPLTEEQFRSLMTTLDEASESLTERERSFVVETFKEGVAGADEGDVRGYVQIVEQVVGDVTPETEPLSREERQALGGKLAKIGEQLGPEERRFVQIAFVRGTMALNEVRGFSADYGYNQTGQYIGSFTQPAANSEIGPYEYWDWQSDTWKSTFYPY